MNQVNPDTFKQKILSKYPNGVTSDGKKYADLDSVDLTRRIVEKFPDGVTQEGVKYSDYLKGATPAAPVDHAVLKAKANADLAVSSAEAKRLNSAGGFLGQFGKELVSNLAPSEVGLGKSLAKIYGNQSDTYLDLITRTTGIQANLLKTIRSKKEEGEDTSKLEKLYQDGVERLKTLNSHLAEENDLPSTGQVAGQLGGTALDILTAGTYGKAAQGMKSFELASKAKSALPTAVQEVKNLATKPSGLFTGAGAAKVAEGGGIGYARDVTQGLSGDRGDDRTGNKAFIPGINTAIGAGLPILTGGIQSVTNRKLANRAKTAEQVDNLVGTVLQGKTDDIERGKRALSNIELDGINTHADLAEALDEKIGAIKKKQGEVLDTNRQALKLKELTHTSKVGEKQVSHNYVQDALDELKGYYKAINDPIGESKIAQLKSKATKEGLTIKEIDSIAVEHGQKLNAFNANGQAASGLSKQAAENTRKGLKTTARNLFKNKVYDESDAVLSDLIRTRDLVEKTAEGVNKLKQKVTQRGLGERVGRLVFQIADKFTGGGLKGFIQSFVPRGEGLKVMNALDLERALGKNLRLIEDALKAGNEETIIQRLEAILEKKSLPTPSVNSLKPIQKYKSLPQAMAARKRAALPKNPPRLKG